MSAKIYKIHEWTRRLDGDGNPIDQHGGCPVCGRSEGFINIRIPYKVWRLQTWGGCHRHKVRWLIWTSRLSVWEYKDEEGWAENADILSGWRKVKPLFPPTHKVDDAFVDGVVQP